MMNTTDFTVVGEEKMHCEGCEQRVGRALKRLPGVREVQANHRSQHVGVEYDLGQVGEEEIRESLDLLGYEVAPGVDAA